jgi:hypothetical protein
MRHLLVQRMAATAALRTCRDVVIIGPRNPLACLSVDKGGYTDVPVWNPGVGELAIYG